MISKAPCILALLPALAASGSTVHAEKPAPILVTGWPLPLNEAQKVILSNDAIMESLVCPGLTRLNLEKNGSEPVLLESLEQTDKTWRFTLRPNLTWWDQSVVSTADLEAFVRETLQPQQLTEGRFAWTIPAFTLTSKDRTLTIQWTHKPEFGPYVFNEHPFRKKTDNALGVQCTGDWRAEPQTAGLLLRDRSGDGRHDILLTPNPLAGPVKAERLLSFAFGDEMPGTDSRKPIIDKLSCGNPLDTPIITVIAWNPQGAMTRDATFRRAITHLTPRGAILRAGAGSMGDLISGPILRAHPGYKRTLLVPAYDPGKSDAMLNELGYRRLEEDGFRRDASGRLLEVKILVRDHAGSALLRKVLDDSFRALGIKLRFITEGEAVPDGLLTGIMTSWPDGDLTDHLHSRVSGRGWPWSWQDKNLDQALEAYALSLTQRTPNFTLLEKIHELVYKLEPFSVLMQHRVCLEASLSRPQPKGEIAVKNPDWFRQLIGL
ncbi:ABC transporter substrate-binding protein [Oligoflexus tunisiensis]|uniref:ABC transporter substrate-binding protein n=1 Tax=Oligoflexus tunisiensis TaxID=708132 RepID=UPI00114CED02|nr:ABC transporter substrate-binding protein [Oligoflexus tunisiensis]